jgi:hypothetical protein
MLCTYIYIYIHTYTYISICGYVKEHVSIVVKNSKARKNIYLFIYLRKVWQK